jgi:hypothetical protein
VVAGYRLFVLCKMCEKEQQMSEVNKPKAMQKGRDSVAARVSDSNESNSAPVSGLETTVIGEHVFLRDVIVGNRFEGVYQVLGVQEKPAKNQSIYSDVLLADKVSRQTVRIWKTAASTIVKKGDYAIIEAYVDEYMGKPQIIANTIQKTDHPTPEQMTEWFVPEMLDRAADQKRFNELRAEIKVFCDKAKDQTCVAVIDHMIPPDIFEQLKNAPGSARPCYGAVGGALARTVRVASLVRTMCTRYKLEVLDGAIAMTGALIHAVGSLKSFAFDGCTAIETKHGALFGSGFLTSVQVASAVKSVAQNIQGSNSDTCERIAHAVASACRCGVKPMTKEAVILESAVRSDAESSQAVDFIDGDMGADPEFTAYDPASGRRYYKPKLKIDA